MSTSRPTALGHFCEIRDSSSGLDNKTALLMVEVSVVILKKTSLSQEADSLAIHGVGETRYCCKGDSRRKPHLQFSVVGDITSASNASGEVLLKAQEIDAKKRGKGCWKDARIRSSVQTNHASKSLGSARNGDYGSRNRTPSDLFFWEKLRWGE